MKICLFFSVFSSQQSVLFINKIRKVSKSYQDRLNFVSTNGMEDEDGQSNRRIVVFVFRISD